MYKRNGFVVLQTIFYDTSKFLSKFFCKMKEIGKFGLKYHSYVFQLSVFEALFLKAPRYKIFPSGGDLPPVGVCTASTGTKIIILLLL